MAHPSIHSTHNRLFGWTDGDMGTSPKSVIVKKLVVAKLVKRSAVFYGTRSFITVFSTTHHTSLFSASWIQFAFSLSNVHFTLNSHLGLYFINGVFLGLSLLKFCMQSFISGMRSVHLFLPDLAAKSSGHIERMYSFWVVCFIVCADLRFKQPKCYHKIYRPKKKSQ